MEGRKAILIEREPQYVEIIRKRLAEAEKGVPAGESPPKKRPREKSV
jgi:DNA modification methylase